MNKYRRFKYPFGGTGYVDPSNPTPDLQTILAYQNDLPVAKNTGSVQPINEPRQYLQEYTERVRPEVERKVNEMNRRPSGNGKIIRNHDKLYDYYKDGDRLYYRKKGGKNWIDISDNDVAQKRINATIAKNKKSYGKPKTSSSDEYTPEEMRAQGFVQNNKGYWVRPEDLKESMAYNAGTLNDVVVTGSKRKTSISTPKRVQGANSYKKDSTKKSNSYQSISTKGISGLGSYRSTVPLTDQERKSTPGAIASTVFRKVKDWLTNSNNRYNQRNGITSNNTSSIVSTRGVGAYR